MHSLCLLVSVLALGVAWAGVASSHGRSVSYSAWEIDASGAVVSLRLKLLELSRLGPEALPPGTLPGHRPPGATDWAARAFPSELILRADGEVCPPDGFATRRPDEAGWVRYQWRVSCPPDAARLSIESRILLDVAPSHMHFARVRFSGLSQGIREQVLTEAAPEFVLRQLGADGPDESVGSSFHDYLSLGIEHILSGWDHLAFVFGLLLLSTRLGEVARLITGFTIAHSLTLALAVLDLVHPRAAAVEAVIAFSVALVAIEKGWRSSGRPRSVPIAVCLGLALLGAASAFGASSLPWLTPIGLLVFSACYFTLVERHDGVWVHVCLTFAFGLVHGFGFAGILVEMTLPTDRLVPALLGFNLGVELGQLGIVLALWPILAVARTRLPGVRLRWASEVSTAAICAIGLYWLVERAFPI